MRTNGAITDIHVIERGSDSLRITMREGGRLKAAPAIDVVSPALIREVLGELKRDEEVRLAARGDVTIRLVDAAFGLARVTVYKERGRAALAIRLLDEQPPHFKDLNLPSIIADFARAPKGLVILTGPVGSGKSTLLAALVRHMDELQMNRHVRIIEAPIEFVHDPQHIVVSHVGVGIRQDADDVFHAFECAKRSDAQVIVFGELLDSKTMVAALEAAYSASVLVIVTMHAPTVGAAILRFFDAFPHEQERRLRALMAESFVGGVSLRLLPRSDVIGIIPAAEVVLGTEPVCEQIRSGSVDTFRASLAGPKPAQTLEQDVQRLVSLGIVDRNEAAQAVDVHRG
jgi:twitching motility protein PilT